MNGITTAVIGPQEWNKQQHQLIVNASSLQTNNITISHRSSTNSTEVSRKMGGWAEKHRYRGGNSSVCNHCQKLIPSQNLKLSVKAFTLLDMKMIRFRSIIYKREITPLIGQSVWGTKEINNQWNLNWNADFEIVWKTDWQHSCSNDIKFCKLMYPCRVHHMVKWSETDNSMLEMRMSLGCGVSVSLSWYQVQYHAACMHTDHENLDTWSLPWAENAWFTSWFMSFCCGIDTLYLV